MKLGSFASKFGKGAITKPIYIYETWLRLIGRGLQLIFALVVVGLYGSRVSSDHRHERTQAVQWVFALVVAALSAVTAIVFAVPQPFVRTARLFAWDFVLFVLWIAAFGTFAVIFLRIPDDDAHKWYENTRVSVMRHAVWIDLVNALFWLGTGAYGCFRTFVSRKIDEKIDTKLEQIEGKVADKVGESKLGSKLGESKLGAKLGAATDIASKVAPHVAPKLAPRLNKFKESV
ncbi:putative uracil phosphoribosyltransferase protein [Rosellinia necatrix]|uniref:Putative uracil phosphoribosyltransferase protein n=1 Tax=Rosellinia necatrix TaxID=77044 RepID=A0A1W2TCS9_ROSNE|nr:putative uracil phosphoribosyltransferase protein [Rosellinia necatrix]